MSYDNKASSTLQIQNLDVDVYDGWGGVCKSLLKFSLCQEPETCTDMCCLFLKP